MPELTVWTGNAAGILAALVLGYLCGSVPFGLLLTRLGGLGDVRKIGSGNIGVTNVLRTGRKDLAVLTLLGDALKGTLAVLLAAGLFGAEAAAFAGLGAFLGHCFPVWLRFRGGKGVATYFGILLAFHWLVLVAAAAIWIATAAISRYSSLAALIMSAAVPPVLFLVGAVQDAELFLIMTVLLWYQHRGNIARLSQGEESRIGR